MSRFDSIIENENFGRLYRNNPEFRALMNQYAFTHPNTRLARLLNKTKIEVDSNNRIQFSVDNRFERFSSMEEALNTSYEPITRTMRYGGAAGPYSMSGPQIDPFTLFMARKNNLEIRLSNIKVPSGDTEDAVVQALQDLIGVKGDTNTPNWDFLGLPVVDQEKVNVLQFLRADKSKLTLSEIMTDVLGASGNEITDVGAVYKRLKALTSDRSIFNIVDPKLGQKIKVATFNPQALFSSDATVKASAEDMARLVSGSSSGEAYDAALKDVYSTMSDGLSYMTHDSYIRQIAATKAEAKNLIDQAKRGQASALHGSFEYEQFAKMEEDAKKLLQNAIESEKHWESGQGASVRVLNADNISTGDVAKLVKGDVDISMEADLRIQKMIEDGIISLPPGMKAGDIDLISSAVDLKNEAFFPNLSGITLNPVEKMGTRVETNILTLGGFHAHIGTDFLKRSLQTDIEESFEALKSGEITPALRRMVNEMKAWEPSPTMGPAEVAQARQGKAFAMRLERFIDSGMPINVNDQMTSEFLNGIYEHYKKFQKGRVGSMLSLDGEEVPEYALRFPMMASTAGHVRNTTGAVGRYRGGISGTIKIDHDSGRFGLLGLDIYKSKAAFGGFDLDDRLYTVLQYDSTAKRLMALTLRDPNEVGEFMYFDADISHDKNIPAEIRQLYRNLHEKKIKIVAGQESNPEALNRLIREHDQLSQQLDSWFRGNSVTITDKLGKQRAVKAQNFIENVDLSQRFSRQVGGVNVFTAPKGFSTDVANFQRPTLLRGFSTVHEVLQSTPFAGLGGFGSPSQALKRIAQAERAEEATARSGRSLFKFQGHDYDYFHKETGFFKDALEGLVDSAKDDPRRLTSQAIEKRIRIESMSNGVLGRSVNMTSVIDEFIQTNLAMLPEDQAQRLVESLKANPFSAVGREAIIDAYTKTANEGILKIADESILKNARNLGRVLAETHSNGLKGVVGLDPLFYQQRIARNKEAVQEMILGYGDKSGLATITDEDKTAIKNLIMLPQSDPKAVLTDLFKFKFDEADRMQKTGSSLIREANESFLGELADANMNLHDPKIEGSAREFINDYFERLSTYRRAEGDLAASHPMRLRGAIEDIISQIPAGATDADIAKLTASIMPEDMNLGSIRKLWQLGYLKETLDEGGVLKRLSVTDKTHQLLLTAARIATEGKLGSESSENVMGMFSTIADEERGLSMLDIMSEGYLKHVRGPQVMRDIQGVRSLEDLYQFLDRDTLELTERATKVFDPIERDFELMRAVGRATQFERHQLESEWVRTFHDRKNIPDLQAAQDEIRRRSNSLFKATRTSDGGVRGGEINKIHVSIFQRVFKGSRSGSRARIILNDMDQSISGIVQEASSPGFGPDTGKILTQFSDIPPMMPRRSLKSRVAPGTGRFLERVTADKAADYVVQVGNVRERMTRFGAGIWNEMMNIPMFRKGAMAAGVFAAIGVTYGVTKDRTPEDMQGPPLLPGGSAYEDYGDTPDMSSMYPSVNSRSGFGNNQGVLYTVNAYGNHDPNALQNRLAEITGATSTISSIYNSRETIKSRGNSQQILAERVGA